MFLLKWCLLTFQKPYGNGKETLTASDDMIFALKSFGDIPRSIKMSRARAALF